MIRAVLFDLDDTLLRLNLMAFIARYVAGASRLLASAARVSPLSLAAPFAGSFLAIDAQDRTDSLTNEQLFNQTFFSACGIPLDDPVIADLMECYEREVVPGYAGGVVSARPVEGAREAVDGVWRAGLVCALATNPTFSLACDRARMGWAGVSEDDFALVSTLANSSRCKPCQPARGAPRGVPHGGKRRHARLRAPRVRAAHRLRGPRPARARRLARTHVRARPAAPRAREAPERRGRVGARRLSALFGEGFEYRALPRLHSRR